MIISGPTHPQDNLSSAGSSSPPKSEGSPLVGVAMVSFRLIIQTSQCGSLIGKGGGKIKDIREVGGVEQGTSFIIN